MLSIIKQSTIHVLRQTNKLSRERVNEFYKSIIPLNMKRCRTCNRDDGHISRCNAALHSAVNQTAQASSTTHSAMYTNIEHLWA